MIHELRTLLDRLCELTSEHGCEISCITWKSRQGERMLMPFVLATSSQPLELRNMPLRMYLSLGLVEDADSTDDKT